MNTNSVKFSQSMQADLFQFLNDLAKKENKTRAALLEEAVLLLEKEKRKERLSDFHEKYIKNDKPLVGKNFKALKMKKIRPFTVKI